MRAEPAAGAGATGRSYSDHGARLWCGALLFLFFAGWAIQLNYWGLWLYARGLDGTEVGLTLAAGLISRAASSALLYPRAMARWGPQRTLRVVLVASVLLAATFALVGGFAGLVVVSVLFGTAYPIVMPLSETLLSALVERGAARYGPLRLWGSVGFLVGILAAAATAARWGADAVVVPMVVVCACSLAHAMTPLPSQTAMTAGPSVPSDPAATGRGASLGMPLTTASLIQGSHGAYFVYAAVIIAAATDDPWVALGIFALAIAAEILGFRLFAAVGEGRGVELLLLAGALGALVRWVALASWPEVWVLAVTQPLHALTFGATHFAYATFVRTRTPADTWARAHGAYGAVAMGLAVAAGSAVAGVVADRDGIGWAFGAMGAAAVVALACATLAMVRAQGRARVVRLAAG